MLETKLPTNYAKTSKSGNDGSLLEIEEEEQLWVGNGTSPMKRKSKVKATSWTIEMYNSPLALVLWVLRERGKIKVATKKRSILTSLDSKSKIAMHWPFLMAFRATLKACSSILCVWILTLKSNLGFFNIGGPRRRRDNSWKTSSRGCSTHELVLHKRFRWAYG